MRLRRLGVALLAGSLVAASAWPAQAISREDVTRQTSLEDHAIEFVSQNPDVYSDPATLDQYTRERMNLMGIQTQPSLVTEPGEVTIMCGTFCYEIIDVHNVWTNSRTVDNYAFPVWESTMQADYGSNGMQGTWSASWSQKVSSTWNVSGQIKAEAKALFFAKIETTVGGGYSRTTDTSWSGSTSVSFDIPAGYQQTLYAYEKGTYVTFNCDCTIRRSDGNHRVTISSAGDGRETYTYQATTFRKGSILPR